MVPPDNISVPVADSLPFRSRFSYERVGSEVRDWIALLKPRVISLVVFTGVIGIYLAPERPSTAICLISILCLCMASGAAGAINMWYDRDIDIKMRRTLTRPLPSGRLGVEDTLVYGCVLSVFSVLLMWVATNLWAAGLLAFSIFFYTVIYTSWLKRSTPQNIVIGGAAGAFPPLIGWVAACGQISWFPVILFAIIFLWTPPHFWSLSLYACKDYTRAGVPMLPVVRGQRYTRLSILAYTFLLLGVTLIPAFLGQAGTLYFFSALILGLGFIGHALRLVRDGKGPEGLSHTGDKPARKAFRYSLFYLFMLFVSLVGDHFWFLTLGLSKLF
ncbi:heme o synthase [Entomobacter blattae]|uniref:Protoheme IX farnesyltransferase n=1 Tax=Entomobacter blattae TaxID=2762277 RepID=A0A7H1NRT5_9PROT|nr:heme o synthase [Entomobacter blattae]QNT78495.1 Protoheme IX farnesyltransferase [Entomobacter blattae]